MPYFVIPTKKDIENNPLFANVTWEELYGDWKCDTCGEHLKEGEAYIILRVTDEEKAAGIRKFRHVRCDSNYIGSGIA